MALDTKCDSLSRQVEDMLYIWADWVKSGVNKSSGYPRMSVLGWLIENGGVIVKSSGPKYPPDNEIAEEMEKWITDLMKEKPEEAKALTMLYVTRQTPEVLASRLKIAKRTFFFRIQIAKTWIEGRYSSKYYRFC